MSSMNFWVSYVNIYFSYNLKPSIPQSKEEIFRLKYLCLSRHF